MATLVQDFRYSVRRLLRAPGFAFWVIVPLAFGIGANTAILSIVKVVLLQPLPYSDPGRLLLIWATEEQSGNNRSELSPANYFDVAERTRSFENIAGATGYWNVNLTGSGDPERLQTEIMSSSLFPLLGIEPALGRAFAAEEDQPGREGVVMLTDSLWKRRFASDRDVIGTTLTLDGRNHTVIGVMPPGAEFLNPETTDIFLPLSYVADRYEFRDQYFLRVVGRLKPGVSPDQAQADLESVGRGLAEEYPANIGRGLTLQSLRESVVGDVRPPLMVLLIMVAGVLLAACANVANMFSARAVTRQREVAIRAALGARQSWLVRQLLTESLVLAAVGGGLGLAIAVWALRGLRVLAPVSLPRVDEIGVNGTVVAFTLGLSVLTALVFGLLPALRLSKLHLNDALRERAAQGTKGTLRLSSALVVFEVATALVLMVGAGLLIRSFVKLQSVDPGFDPTNVLTVQISLPGADYPSYGQRHLFFEQLVERIEALPGVVEVGGVNYLPLAGGEATASLYVKGRPLPPGGSPPGVGIRMATQGYFEAMHIDLKEGRVFTREDNIETPGVVAIINETLKERMWPDKSSLGEQIQIGRANPDGPWGEIIGVVEDVRHRGIASEPQPEVYIHMLDAVPLAMTLVIRCSVEPRSLLSLVRQETANLDKNLPIYDISTLEELFDKSISRQRFLTTLLTIFGVVALVLGTTGIYGVISYSVSRRTHELGLRQALGAQRRDVLGLIVGSGIRLTLVGVVGGLILAFALSRLMSTLVYDTSTLDPLIFVGVPALMLAVSALASYLPSLPALRINPVETLRIE